VGADVAEITRSIPFCQHAIPKDRVFEVHDATKDKRFQHNPLVTEAPNIRFYAESQLIGTGGHRLGTLCVLDTVPRKLTPEQRRALSILAKQVVSNFELRLKQYQLEKEKQQLLSANKKLDQFVHMVSHDLKEPIMNINTIAEWMQDDMEMKDYGNLASNLLLVKDRVRVMEELVSGLLQYAMTQVKDLPHEKVDVYSLVQGLLAEHSDMPQMKTHVSSKLPVLTTERVLLQQVFANLISNAYKYHHTGQGNIWVDVQKRGKEVVYCVKDDGPGIPPHHHQKVFGLFERLLHTSGKIKGSGIGLATVKRIIEDRGGRIWIESEAGTGTSFLFTWPE
jgi:signal transduction histidine kinase